MDADHAVRMIEDAFHLRGPRGGGAARITDDECERVAGDLALFRPDDLLEILPQILVILLRRADPKKLDTGIAEVLSDLDFDQLFKRDYQRIAKERGAEEAEYWRAADAHAHGHRVEAYAGFTTAQAAAIVAFLEAVRDWPATKIGNQSFWDGAYRYWRQRSSGEDDPCEGTA